MTQNINQSLGKNKGECPRVFGQVGFRINKRTIHIYGIHCHLVIRIEKRDDFRKRRLIPRSHNADLKGSQVCPGVASLTFVVDHKPENRALSRNLKAMTVGQTLLASLAFLLESEKCLNEMHIRDSINLLHHF